MKIKHIIILAMSLFGLLECTNGLAAKNISFIISKDFPTHFYCHFRAYRRELLHPMVLRDGGWSSRYYADSTYHQGGPGLEVVVVSCFDNHFDEKILPTGHLSFCRNVFSSNKTVNITHSGEQVLFNGIHLHGYKECGIY